MVFLCVCVCMELNELGEVHMNATSINEFLKLCVQLPIVADKVWIINPSLLWGIEIWLSQHLLPVNGGGGGGTVNFINTVTFWCEQPCLYLTTVTDFINVNNMFIK